MVKYGKRIIILIDDIDRLDKESMCLIFKLIRLNADFINTIYILSFDRKVVENALEGEQGISGRKYLEKFIQVPFDLPLPDHKIIAEILSEKIEKIFPPSAKKEFESYRGGVIRRKFYMFFRTLRDVKRYSNSILLTLPSINDEINYLDFAALETIRIFCPDVYIELAKNKEVLLGNKPTFSLDLNREQIEKRKADINSLIKSKCEDKYQSIIVLDLIHELFPHAGEADYYGHDQCYRIDKRICSSNRFDKYFLLDVPEGEISQLEIDKALKIIDDKGLFTRLLKEYNEHDILMQFLDRMKDYINEISHENTKNIIEAFFDVGDELSIMDNGRININIKIKMGFLIRYLIERIEDPIIRSRILMNCIENAKGIYILLYVVFRINEKNDNKRIISKEELQTIKNLVVKRIKEYTSEENFIKKPHLNLILFRWRDFGNANEPREFVSKLIKDDQGVIKLLAEFLTESYDGCAIHYSLEPHNLEELSEFVDLPIIYSKLRHYLEI